MNGVKGVKRSGEMLGLPFGAAFSAESGSVILPGPPVLHAQKVIEFLPEGMPQRQLNKSNLVNWLLSVQRFYGLLGDTDFQALSIIDFALKIGRIPTDVDKPLLMKKWPELNVGCRASYSSFAMSGIRGLDGAPKKPCDGFVWRAANLLTEKSVTEIVSRAIRLLQAAPKIQDDLEVFIGVSDDQIERIPRPGLVDYETGDEVFDYQLNIDHKSFVAFDTSPGPAFERASFDMITFYNNYNVNNNDNDNDKLARLGGFRRQTAQQTVQQSAQRNQRNQRSRWGRHGGSDGSSSSSTGISSDGGQIVVARLVVRAGTPVLPVFMLDMPSALMTQTMPLVFAPDWFTVPGFMHVRKTYRCGFNGVVEGRVESFQFYPAKEVPEAKTGLKAPGLDDWPPLPVVYMQPPVQKFQDVPLTSRLPAIVQAGCGPNGWTVFMDLLASGKLIGTQILETTACFARQQAQRPVPDEIKLPQDFDVYLTTINNPSGGLLLFQPQLEKDMPARLKPDLLWYRERNQLRLPRGAAMLTAPCDKPLSILPLTLAAREPETGKHVGHKNVLIIDHVRKLVERYEPHGAVTGAEFLNFADNLLPTILGRLLPGYRYEPPSASCPAISGKFLGAQSLAAEERVGSNGYCECWTWMYIVLRLLNPAWSPAQIMVQMNRGGASNWSTRLPNITTAIFPQPYVEQKRLLMTMPRDEHALMLVRYIQMFNTFVRRAIARAIQSAPSPPPPLPLPKPSLTGGHHKRRPLKNVAPEPV